MKRLEELQFHSRFTTSLAGIPECFSYVTPTKVASPEILAWSVEMAEHFALEKPESKGATADLLGGNLLLKNMKPFSVCYGGHQFGNWAGQLGDGRAITLGELPGLDGKLWEIQLKGAGITPYSRRGDGRAVLRSSMREFICSEAMHHLGVPTTRALSLVLTGDKVERDMFYDGHPRLEPGAIVCRVSESFLRFGNFEIFASRGELTSLEKLFRFTISTYFSEFEAGDYLGFFQEVTRRTALLMAHWMRVGFVHGVMNTDNMSILGLTIDYGPYGWLENYDPLWTPNTTDLPGRRYCYGRQPNIALWNLVRLAEAIAVLLPSETKALETILDGYTSLYEEFFSSMLANKLGLRKIAGSEDRALLQEMFSLLQATETDLTLFFRGLTDFAPQSTIEALPDFLLKAFYVDTPNAEISNRWRVWLCNYRDRFMNDSLGESRLEIMKKANPLYVPRNYLLQEAIEAAELGDYSPLHALQEVLRNPYTEQTGKEKFAAKRPGWAKNKAGSSTLSCSS